MIRLGKLVVLDMSTTEDSAAAAPKEITKYFSLFCQFRFASLWQSSLFFVTVLT